MKIGKSRLFIFTYMGREKIHLVPKNIQHKKPKSFGTFLTVELHVNSTKVYYEKSCKILEAESSKVTH
jgi:hypothetical protein